MKFRPFLSFEKLKRGEYSRQIAAPLIVLATFILIRISAGIDTMLTRENEYAAEIILQLMIFLFPALLYLVLTGQTLRGKRLRPFGPGHLLLLLSALVCLICGSLLINLQIFGYDTLSGGYDLYGIFTAKNTGKSGDTAYLILAYAFLPAICEEFVFRGLLSCEYEKRSTTAAILMPSLFFAMLHFDFENFPVLFFSGVVLALTMYASRSVLASMTVHFFYNLNSVFGRTLFQTLYDLGGETFFIFLITSLFLFSSFMFCAEAARLYRSYSDRNLESDYRKMNPPYAAPGSEELKNNPVAAFSAKFPRISATLTAILSPTALVCYVFYFAVIFLG